MDNIAKDLQDVAVPPDELERATALAKQANQTVRVAADARLRFEDEPASYFAVLNGRA